MKTKRKGDLKVHVTAYCHTNETNLEWHKCDHCDYKAKVKSNLRKHVKKRHL